MYCIQYVLLVEDMVGVTVTMWFCDLSLHIWSPEPPRNLSLVRSQKNIAGTRIDKKREIFSRPQLGAANLNDVGSFYDSLCFLVDISLLALSGFCQTTLSTLLELWLIC